MQFDAYLFFLKPVRQPNCVNYFDKLQNNTNYLIQYIQTVGKFRLRIVIIISTLQS